MRTKIMHWIWAGKPEWLANFVNDHMEFVPKLLCRKYGHHPERDQCNRPEHDYCLWCLKSMPNSWKPQQK